MKPQIGNMVRVLAPVSKHSPQDGWTGCTLRVTDVSEKLQDACLSDSQGTHVVYISWQRLEVLPPC